MRTNIHIMRTYIHHRIFCETGGTNWINRHWSPPTSPNVPARWRWGRRLEETWNKPTLVMSLFLTQMALFLSLKGVREEEVVFPIISISCLLTTALYLIASLIRGASLPDCCKAGVSKKRAIDVWHLMVVYLTKKHIPVVQCKPRMRVKPQDHGRNPGRNEI